MSNTVRNKHDHLIGRSFNRLTVLGFVYKKHKKEKCFRYFAQCICSCKNKTLKEIMLKQIISEKTKSCGCLALEVRTKHGMSEDKEFKKEYKKQWKIKNKEIIAKKDKEYRANNREEINRKRREREVKDLSYKIARRLRTRLYVSVKGGYVNGSAIRDLGCTIDCFKQYIANKFQNGMSWDNWGQKTWHLDHIIPLKKFDLNNPEQVKKACHYTNYQPLWALDNLIKGAKTPLNHNLDIRRF